MSNREIAIELIRKLPENVSLYEIAREIEFVAGVREGFQQLERGQGVSAEKVKSIGLIKFLQSCPHEIVIPPRDSTDFGSPAPKF